MNIIPKFKTPEQFNKDIYAKYGDKFTVASVYKRSNEAIKLKCNKCGTIFTVLPNNILRRNFSCCNCRVKFPEYADKVFNKYRGRFKVMDPYKGWNIKIRYYCVKHDFVFSMTPTTFRRSTYKCPKCKYEHNAKVQRKHPRQFLTQLRKVHDGTIICLDTYVNTHTPLNFQCKVCGCKFKTEPNAILRLSGCPQCAFSKGEDTINQYLINSNIDFVSQYKFPNCRYKRPLPFDFWVPDYNLLIEYDGMQHTKEIKFFGGDTYLENIKKHDAIKNKYAIENNINLLRIPYTVKMENIETVLSEYLHTKTSSFLISKK